MAFPVDLNRTVIEGMEVMLGTSGNLGIDGVVHLTIWDAVTKIEWIPVE